MRKSILIVIFCIFSVVLYAEPVSREDAQQVAINFYLTITNKNSVSVKFCNTRVYKDINTYYTFVFENKDWVIVSGDNNIEPILAFSTERNYSNNKPPACEALLNQYDEYIYYMAFENKKEDQAIVAWLELKSNNYKIKKNAIVAPLLVTNWGQSNPNDDDGNIEAYNYYMPDANDLDYIEESDCSTNCLAGCPAVAIGQILKYWERPDCYQFDWLTMSNELNYYNNSNYETERNAISSFLYYLGNLLNNKMPNHNYYCVNGNCASGIYEFDEALNVFVNDMSCVNAEIINRIDYSNSEWDNLLTEQLNYSKPVFYGGYRLYFGGHVYVVDGYFKNWVAYKYHVNWGWCGANNGYYRTVDMLYNQSQAAIINIFPLACDNELTIYESFSSFPFGLSNTLYYYPIAGYIYSSPESIVIESNEHVQYKAYNQIVLENFETEDGAEFTAEIIQCPINCDFGIEPPTINLNKISYVNNNEENTTDEIKVHPNPTSSLVTINVGCLFTGNDINMDLFDIFGNKIMQKQFNNRETHFDMKSCQSGVYIIRINAGTKTYYKKLIKK